METRHVNLIFQGGGVKGLTYAGAFSTLPNDVKPRVVGGTSAGAIAAALIAIGMDKNSLRNAMEQLELETLLDEHAMATIEELKDLFSTGSKLLTSTERSPGMFAIAKFAWSSRKKIRKHLQQILSKYGLFESEKLRAWLVKHIGDKTFAQIATEDLRIVGSSLDKRALKPYSKVDSRIQIVDAVVASASIPFFFVPARLEGYMVDGGLLSNFPVLLFNREPYPTVGFRLIPFIEPNKEIGRFGQFLKALVETSLDAHDRIQRRPDHYHEETIYFPNAIGPVSFGLSPEQKMNLLQLGEAAGRRVDWLKFSSSRPLMEGLDPNPDKVVSRVLVNGNRLADFYNCLEHRPEELTDDNTFSVRVNADGTVHYALTQRVSVKGQRPWYGASQKLIFASIDAIAGVSLVDLHWTMKEEEEDLPRFPIENGLTKGFVFCFTPPITESDPERCFEFSWQMPREFERTLCAGGQDSISFTAVPRAERHKFRLTLELSLDPSLGPVSMRGMEGTQKSPPQQVVIGDRAYVKHTWSSRWTDVDSSRVYELNLTRGQ